MTQEEKDEIRQIIREELNASRNIPIPQMQAQYCQHEWVINVITAGTGTGSFAKCRKCGVITSFPAAYSSQ